MEYEWTTTKQIQEEIVNSRSLHNKVIKPEDNMRSENLRILRSIRNSQQPSYVITQYAFSAKKELRDLLSTDEKLDNMLKENKYNFEVAGQN